MTAQSVMSQIFSFNFDEGLTAPAAVGPGIIVSQLEVVKGSGIFKEDGLEDYSFSLESGTEFSVSVTTAPGTQMIFTRLGFEEGSDGPMMPLWNITIQWQDTLGNNVTPMDLVREEANPGFTVREFDLNRGITRM